MLCVTATLVVLLAASSFANPPRMLHYTLDLLIACIIIIIIIFKLSVFSGNRTVWRHSQNNIATPPQKDRATATCNIHTKFSELWPCGFWDTWADTQTQTDRQTHIRNTHHNVLHQSRGRRSYCVIFCFRMSLLYTRYICVSKTTLMLHTITSTHLNRFS